MSPMSSDAHILYLRVFIHVADLRCVSITTCVDCSSVVSIFTTVKVAKGLFGNVNRVNILVLLLLNCLSCNVHFMDDAC